MALLIVATKLYFPFPENSSPSRLRNTSSFEMPTLDWDIWRQGKRNLPTQHEKRTTKFDFDKVTPSQVVSMADDELDAYFAHVSSLIDSTSELQCNVILRLSTKANSQHLDDNPITKFFPVEELPASTTQVEDVSAKDLDDAVKNLLSQTLEYNLPDAVEGAEFKPSAMPRYEAFRRIEHLSETAKELYTAAGKYTLGTDYHITYTQDRQLTFHPEGLVVGASLETMTDAVYRIERAMVVWQSKQLGTGSHY